ncbi:MAG: TRAP transporter small permease [Deltaproteobacteria bacterium]|nr:TRAP transporter small permease [Deltaproteobacteria bacterium]
MSDTPVPASPTGLRWLLANLEEVACVAMMSFMALLGFANVVTRYLGFALAYTEEILVALMVWITLLGAAVGFKRGAHLGLTFLRERLGRFWRRAVEALSLALTVGVIGLVSYLCVRYHLADEIAMDTRSQALDIPQFYYTLALPVGGVAIIIRAIQATLAQWRREGEA